MNLVTVLTPTYNRAWKLEELYKSLVCQTDKRFEWLIVDDGSDDNTQELIGTFIKEQLIQINYIKKENGGKHTALNDGIQKSETTWTIIVDSDDTLIPSAIEDIIRYGEKYINEKNISGLSFLRAYKNGRPIVPIDKDEFVDNYISYRIKGNKPGDMAEVFKTEILRKYPFPVFSGEKFMSEDVVWIEMGKTYDYVFINKAIYVCEYLENGLTANDKPMKFASPLGSMLRGKQLLNKECGWKNNVKGAIIYNCYRRIYKGKIPTELKVNSILVLIMKPIGKIFYAKWKP